MSKQTTIQLLLKPDVTDAKGVKTEQLVSSRIKKNCGAVKFSKFFTLNLEIRPNDLFDYGYLCIADPIIENFYLNKIEVPPNCHSFIAIAKLPGVTDDEGISAQNILADFLNVNIDLNTQSIFSQEIYFFENELSEKELKYIGENLLGNPLINKITYGNADELKEKNQQLYFPKVKLETEETVNTIDLNISDEALVQLSKKMVLALSLIEMQTIKNYYNNPKVIAKRKKKGLPQLPTDCELEVLAQTWSEHCKHKEFNAKIEYTNKETGESKTINSLFKTYIRNATLKVKENLKKKNNDWLVTIFSDNAGVVKINSKYLFVWKVETHNSPSALDPYGGAITGILGNNRDPLGTGIGGARLLFNTNVLCFGPPNYSKPLLKGQMHPSQILEGVRHGIEDGGNKSGIPTVNGSIVFDERYSGKPLVYCGTGGIMPYKYQAKDTWLKPIVAGDLILMLGGRVGKDGIHGATFSSVEIDEHSPHSAVQIGSPITQKMAADFLIIACEKGLIKCSTDNGAGGLSSSIGELATISGGADVYLEKVPLKYSGLKPWEIFVSESQERMSLVIEKDKLKALHLLAKKMEVELTEIGIFTDSGELNIYYKKDLVASLDMEFLHEGDPQKEMIAEWSTPYHKEPIIPTDLNYNDILIKLMSSLNICSREKIIRQFDHEVKGKTVLKSLMGKSGKAPQDAAVMRIDFESYEGIAVSNGIIPRYGDIDPYEMSAGAFDEAIRQIISIGGQLPNLSENDEVFWSVNDNFCVPDSEYHPKHNKDGKQKLAKLVQMCEALYDMSTFYDIPMTSGKDSMKNDFKREGVKISVPPTILYSMTAKIDNIKNIISSDFKMEGDLIYQLGETYDELGASEFYQLFDAIGNNVPKVRKEKAKDLYLKIAQANKLNLIESSHDLSDGGLTIALVESTFAQNFGVNISIDNFNNSLPVILFSESHSRFVVSIKPINKKAFEKHFSERFTFLGVVTKEPMINIKAKGKSIINIEQNLLLEAWENGLSI